MVLFLSIFNSLGNEAVQLFDKEFIEKVSVVTGRFNRGIVEKVLNLDDLILSKIRAECVNYTKIKLN